MTIPDYLTDIAIFLESSGAGITGKDIFLYDFAPNTVNCIALTPIAGLSDETSLSGKFTLYRPELNIRIRNKCPKNAEDKATKVFNILNMLVNKPIGSTRFKRIEALSPPFFVSKDGNYGTIYSINFILYIE